MGDLIKSIIGMFKKIEPSQKEPERTSVWELIEGRHNGKRIWEIYKGGVMKDCTFDESDAIPKFNRVMQSYYFKPIVIERKEVKE